MAVNGYIQLACYDGSNSKKRFRALQGSSKPERQKTQTRKRTLTGKADTQEGFVINLWTMTIKCKYQVEDANEGTLADLRAFFEKIGAGTDANSARLTFWEFDDSQVHKVEMTGSLTEDNVIPMVTGTEAEFYVPVVLEKVD